MSTTEAQKMASIRYAKKHLKRVPLDMQLSDYEELKAAAENAGESVIQFL